MIASLSLAWLVPFNICHGLCLMGAQGEMSWGGCRWVAVIGRHVSWSENGGCELLRQ